MKVEQPFDYILCKRLRKNEYHKQKKNNIAYTANDFAIINTPTVTHRHE